MINTMGGEQDNVVFLGRRSFRMEIAGAARSNELPIPIRGSAVPTEKIVEADRGREAWIETAAAAAALQPAKLKPSGSPSVVALCGTTFVLGIALTLTFTARVAPRRAPVAAPVQPAQVAAPAEPAAQAAAPATATTTSSVIVQPMPVAAPTEAEILAGFASAPSRRPVARPARAVRPRGVRAAQTADSADTEDPTVADPFAEPPVAAKPAAAKPAAAKRAVAKPAAAKDWVDPFAE